MRPAWWSWLPSTAKIGTSSCRHAAAITSACSGSPLVVRSPARRTTSASPSQVGERAARRARRSRRRRGCRLRPQSDHAGPCCAIGQTGNDPAMPEPTFEELIDAMQDARRRPPAHGDPVRARRRPLGVGARRSAQRARRRLPHPAERRRHGARRVRRRGLEDAAAARGLARQELAPERRARRPDLQPGERADHRRARSTARRSPR